MEESRKKTKRIIAVVVLSVFALAISGLIGYRCGKRKGDEANANIDRYVRFTDRATGKIYDIGKSGSHEVRIPYDGLEHTFTYEVLSVKGDKPLGQKGDFYKDDRGYIAKEPKQYSFEVVTSVNRYVRYITMLFVIEEPIKLQPEMKFEPNGAIEFVDGEYYKYKHTGFYCKPKAYAEYEGTRLEIVGEALIIYCKNNAIEGHSFAAPRDVGVYTVGFEIANYQDDPDRKIYNFVTKEITIEIVE